MQQTHPGSTGNLRGNGIQNDALSQEKICVPRKLKLKIVIY